VLVLDVTRAARFHVLCAGEGAFSVDDGRLVPRGATLSALALARGGVRVGLASVFEDRSHARSLVADAKDAGVDVEGVAFAPARSAIVAAIPSGDASPIDADDATPVVVPDAWSADVLLLSTVSPSIPVAAAMCRLARATRRAGARVVVDVNARRLQWAGRDPRTIHGLLREAHVVRVSASDLFGLWTDVEGLRRAMRPDATLIWTEGGGVARAMGAFGEIASAPRERFDRSRPGAGDVFTAAICRALHRHDALERVAWDRVLHDANEAARAWLRRRV
jgi:sugar/nucleoside kinase (ribokinase family)